MSDIKKNVKDTYTRAALENAGCGCGPADCSDIQSAPMNESYTGISGYESAADLGLGCGIPTEFARIKAGDTVLDLGSGAGNDVFVARNLTGESGFVIGVDMTEAMHEKANTNKKKLGYENVSFRLGEIENLPLENNTVDVAISNCVMNLVPDKKRAYAEVYRVLKPGGHFSISDIVLKGNLPEGIMKAAEMYAGCVSGALNLDDYLDAIKLAGFQNVKVVKERTIHLPDEIVLRYVSKKEADAWGNSNNQVVSVTVYGEK